MVSKNNLEALRQRNREHEHQRFGLRKLTVGVASVLLGTTFYLGMNSVAHADTVNANTISVEEQQNSTNTKVSEPTNQTLTLNSNTASTANVDTYTDNKVENSENNVNNPSSNTIHNNNTDWSAEANYPSGKNNISANSWTNISINSPELHDVKQNDKFTVQVGDNTTTGKLSFDNTNNLKTNNFNINNNGNGNYTITSKGNYSNSSFHLNPSLSYTGSISLAQTVNIPISITLPNGLIKNITVPLNLTPAKTVSESEKHPLLKFVSFGKDPHTGKIGYGIYINYNKVPLTNLKLDGNFGNNQTIDKDSINAYHVQDNEMVDANGQPINAINHDYSHDYDYDASVGFQNAVSSDGHELSLNTQGPLTLNNKDYSTTPLYVYFTTTPTVTTGDGDYTSNLSISGDGILATHEIVKTAQSGNSANSNGKNQQQSTAIIDYIDDTTGKTLKTDTVSGKFNDPINYDPTQTINDYKNQNYELVSNNFAKNAKFNTDNNSYEIHLKHTTNVETQIEKPQQIIYYLNADTLKDVAKENTQTLTITRQVTTDKVTGETTYSDWKAEPGMKFKDITSPEIPGYTTTDKKITGHTMTDRELENGLLSEYKQLITVWYAPTQQTAQINYIDDTTNNTLRSDEINGKFNSVIKFSQSPEAAIKEFENQGYKLVSNDFDNQKFNSDNTKNVFNVHFAHNTQSVTQNVKAGSATVHFVDAKTGNKLADDTNITGKSVTQTGLKDLVTNKVIWEPVHSGLDIHTITAPNIKGYTPDHNKQVVTITANNHKEYTIKYTKNDDKKVTRQVVIGNAVVHLVDSQTGKPVHEDIKVPGKTVTQHGLQDPVTDKITWSPLQIDMQTVDIPDVEGYTHSQKKQVVTLTAGKTNEYTVKYDHATQEVTREIKAGKAIVHFVDEQTDKPVHDDVTLNGQTITQHGIKDLATNTIKWTPTHNHLDIRTVTVPDVKGYTHSQKKQVVNIVNEKTNEYTIKYTKQAPKPVSDNKSFTQIIHYQFEDGSKAANDSKQTVTLTRTGSQDAVTDKINWNSWSQNNFIDVNSPSIKGYTPDQVIVKGSNANSDKNITVTYTKNQSIPVSDSKTVTETIHYQFEDGSKANDDHVQTIKLTRQGSKDPVTDKITWNDWTTDNFDAVESPQIDGYTPDKVTIISIPANGDKDIIVTYIKKAVPETPTTSTTIPNKPSAEATGTVKTNTVNTEAVKTNVVPTTFVNAQPAMTKTSEAKKLPQTGHSDNNLGLLGLLTAGLSLGLLDKKKHIND